jgi:AP-3 complex subunit mu
VIDNGFPLTTEISLLHDLVRPPVDLVKSLASAVNQPSQGTGRSAVPWRKSGIRYVNNEIFFDIVEEINCIVDVNGMATVQEVVGRIMVNCRLSGMPDLLLNFKDPTILEDVSLHPCVRYAKFE